MSEQGSGRQKSTEKAPELKRLEIFTGKWKTEGQTHATEAAPGVGISGTDSYEWLPGGFFLFHLVDVRVGDEPVRAIEIIGYDNEKGSYPMQSYDNHGGSPMMQLTANDNGTWVIEGDGKRSTIHFTDNGNTMNGKWEQGEDGNWTPFMDVKLTKITPE